MTIHDHPECACLCVQCDAANRHRRRADAACERAALAEQAVKWCRGRIAFLESESSALTRDRVLREDDK
jgi:hypothetical protein